jgi:hypothetical protein
LQEVERQLMEARMANARLMEDNESYQLLLQEKTLKGDFGAGDFSYSTSNTNQDALDALEGRTSVPSLADELSEAAGGEPDEVVRRLEMELKSAKDQNKALTLYINKIIERLLQHQDFEHILDTSSDGRPNTNKELPPPPGPSLIQRVKTMAMGESPQKPRPRPMSFMPPPPLAAHSNPDTAPSIPLSIARSSSVRRPAGRPMSEQFTGASSVVAAMYKGPGASELSPPLRPSQTFQLGSGQRTPSGGAAALPMSSSGNFPGMRSETSSTSGDSGSGEVTTPPAGASPPRDAASRERTAFAGTKPRPLRLVQENPEVKGGENKRASWIGWAFGKKDEATLTGGDAIKE